MIDLARENSKSVKCPYMGCNCKDFKKTDLVKDKEVLGHLTKVREEQEKAENEKKEEELRAREERKRKKEQGNDSDKSADSIVEEVIEMIRDKNGKEVPVSNEPNLSETSSDTSTSSSTSDNSSSSEAPTSKSSTDNEPRPVGLGIKSVPNEPESGKLNEKTSRVGKNIKRSNKRRRMVSDSDDSVERPVSKVRSKRNRKRPQKLDNSLSCSKLDEADSDNDLPEKQIRKNANKTAKKIKIVGKKVTETWCIQKEAARHPKKRRAKEKWSNILPVEDCDSDEDIPLSMKGKSSKNKPPKNASKEC